MLNAKVREFTEDDEKEPIGIKDGGHVILECSSCGRGLIDVFRTQPDAIDPLTGDVFEWKLQAKCCFCGDRSYVAEVKGKFHIGGFGQIKEEDPTTDIPETFPADTDEEGDVLVIDTVRA